MSEEEYRVKYVAPNAIGPICVVLSAMPEKKSNPAHNI